MQSSRAARMASNLRVMKEAQRAGSPQPSGDGYSFDELNAAEMPPAESAEPPSGDANADALALLGELNEV